jgi:hypothetical protein
MGMSVGVAEGRTAVGGSAVGVCGAGVGVEGSDSAVGREAPGVGSTWNEKLQPSSNSEHKIMPISGGNEYTRFIA